MLTVSQTQLEHCVCRQVQKDGDLELFEHFVNMQNAKVNIF